MKHLLIGLLSLGTLLFTQNVTYAFSNQVSTNIQEINNCALQTATGTIVGLTVTTAATTAACAGITAPTVVGEVLCIVPGGLTLLGTVVAGITGTLAYLWCETAQQTMDAQTESSHSSYRDLMRGDRVQLDKSAADVNLEIAMSKGICTERQYLDFRHFKQLWCDQKMKRLKPGPICNGTGLPRHLRVSKTGKPGKIEVLWEVIEAIEKCMQGKSNLGSCYGGMDQGHQQNYDHLNDLRKKCLGLHTKYLKQ